MEFPASKVKMTESPAYLVKRTKYPASIVKITEYPAYLVKMTDYPAYLVKMTESLHKVVNSVRDWPAGDGLQHRQELLKGHPRVLLTLIIGASS